MIELNKLEQTVQALPPKAQKELLSFVDYLRHKYQGDSPNKIVQLGGLWADVNLDISDEDVRALRRQISLQLVDKI